MNVSAGILLYRKTYSGLEFLLVHPGGPFFRKKDKGWWTIPKGIPEENESLEEAAIREMLEETGITVYDMVPLGSIRQKGGKEVHAWAAEGNWKEEDGLPENTFTIEWPPCSGRNQAFPEIDKAKWYTESEARSYINERQIPFLDRLVDLCL